MSQFVGTNFNQQTFHFDKALSRKQKGRHRRCCYRRPALKLKWLPLFHLPVAIETGLCTIRWPECRSNIKWAQHEHMTLCQLEFHFKTENENHT